MNPPVGFSPIYLDHQKAGLHLPLFPLLINVLKPYPITPTQLDPNVIKIGSIPIVFQRNGVEASVTLFRIFFM